MKFRLQNVTNGKSTLFFVTAPSLTAALAHKKVAALKLTLVEQHADYATLDDRTHERTVFGRPLELQRFCLEQR